jgi:hypothetical protein
MKKGQNDKNGRRIRGCRHHRRTLGLAAKPLTQPPQEGSGYIPANFQAKKTKIVAPGPVSVEG